MSPSTRIPRGVSPTHSSANASSEAAPGRYRIQTVARLTGLGTPLLRQWERRHRLAEPERSPSGYREYTDDDVEVFRRARDLLGRGLTIGEIAKIGREGLLRAPTIDDLVPRASELAHDRDHALVARFITAARRGSVSQLDEMIARALHGETLPDAIEHFVRPTLEAVGVAWERGQIGPGIERIVSSLFRDALASLLTASNVGLGPVEVVSAPGIGDTHDLGALMLAITMAKAGHRTIHLGGPLRIEHVVEVALACSPRLLALSYVRTVSRDAFASQLRALRSALPRRVSIAVGGRGMVGLEREAQSAGVELPASPVAALALLAGAP